METPFELLSTINVITDISDNIIKKYEKLLPEELILEWGNRGLCFYLNGLLRTVNPEDYYEMMTEWDDSPEKCHVIFVTAFGDFYFVKDGNIYAQAVHQKLRTNLQNNLRLVIKFSFSTANYQKNVLHNSLYRQSLKKYGGLKSDEIFSFFPAISLGGNYSLEYVKKVKLKEHLSFLAQL